MSEENNQEQNSEQKTFPETYVKELREENKQARLKATELENKLNEIIKQNEEKEKEKATEQGKFKELFESESEKVKRLELELQDAKVFEEKYTAIETQTRTELLEKLDESHKKIADKLGLDDLKEYVKLNTKDGHNYDDKKPGGKAFVLGDKGWDDLSMEEKDELFKKNPTIYNKLKKAKYKN